MRIYADFAGQRPLVDDGYIKVSTVTQQEWAALDLDERRGLILYEQFLIFEQLQKVIAQVSRLGIPMGFDIPFFRSSINAELASQEYQTLQNELRTAYVPGRTQSSKAHGGASRDWYSGAKDPGPRR